MTVTLTLFHKSFFDQQTFTLLTCCYCGAAWLGGVRSVEDCYWQVAVIFCHLFGHNIENYPAPQPCIGICWPRLSLTFINWTTDDPWELPGISYYHHQISTPIHFSKLLQEIRNNLIYGPKIILEERELISTHHSQNMQNWCV